MIQRFSSAAGSVSADRVLSSAAAAAFAGPSHGGGDRSSEAADIVVGIGVQPARQIGRGFPRDGSSSRGMRASRSVARNADWGEQVADRRQAGGQIRRRPAEGWRDPVQHFGGPLVEVRRRLRQRRGMFGPSGSTCSTSPVISRKCASRRCERSCAIAASAAAAASRPA